jgi:hypothetical protein
MMYEDYDPERDRQDVGHLIVGIIIGLWALFLMTMCTGCTTTKYVQVPEYHTDTLIQTKVLKDSVWLCDSTYIREKGDTVLIERWHTQYKWREVHDTTYVSKTDSIPYPVEVTKEVPAELTWWQQTRLHLANILLIALALCAVVWIGKNHIKRLMP